MRRFARTAQLGDLPTATEAGTPYVYDKKFITFAESLEFLNSNSIKSSSGKSDSKKSLLKLINEIQN